MVIVWALSWWYGKGWRAEAARILERLQSSYDYFSIGLLLKTLFSPYKQISAGNVAGSLSVQLRAFIDKTMSRIIGSVIRFTVVVVGSVWMLVQLILGAIILILWLILPAAPLAGFILMVSGVVPAWI